MPLRLIFLVTLLITSTALPNAPLIVRLKRLYPRTPLVINGRANALIAPGESSELRQLAHRLRVAIHVRTGVALPIIPAEQFVNPDWQVDFGKIGSRNIIALGNVNDNRLLAVLYGERYVVADSIYPGKGGYVIRTVHDPFANGINIVVLAGSYADGVKRAIDVFTRKFIMRAKGDLVLEQPVVDVQFERRTYRFFPDPSPKRQPQYTTMEWLCNGLRTAGFMDASGRIVKNVHRNATLVDVIWWLARIGGTYFRTGNEKLLTLMKQLIAKNPHLLTKPPKLEGMGARTAYCVHEWDLLEELPIWTDDERLAITNALLIDARIGHERRAFHEQVRKGARQAMDENHGTFSALHSFNAWHYFYKYYRDQLPECEYWMRCAQAVFSAQASTFQIPEDASGYLTYCPMHAMSYALKSRDLTYFKRGIAYHHARYIALACMNNLGLNTGFGDSPNLVCPEFFEVIAPPAWFYRDPYLNWVVRNFLPKSCGLRIFQKSIAINMSVPAKEPVEWTGVIRIPLYEMPLKKGEATDKPVFAPKRDLGFQFFNKIIFKENWARDGQYLLLDGAGTWGKVPGPHGHKHNDINTIINFTALGRMWLVDHTYEQRSFEDHSGVILLRQGAGGYRKRTLATLLNLAEDDAFGATRTKFMNWERCIFWKKGRYFLIIDKVTAERDGEHFARAIFKTLGDAKLDGDALLLTQRGRFCKIVTDGEAQIDLEQSRFTNPQWQRFYPYAKPIATFLHEDKQRSLKAGESITFMNLLYPFADMSDASAVQMVKASESCALVEEHSGTVLMGIGGIPSGVSKCDMFIASNERLLLVGFQALADDVIRANRPCNLSLNLAKGTLLVDARDGVTLSFREPPRTVMLNGRRIHLSRNGKRWQLTIDAGEHELALQGWGDSKHIAQLVNGAISGARKAAVKFAKKARAGYKVKPPKGVSIKRLISNVHVWSLITADVNRDGRAELLVGSGDGMSVYTSDGALLWRFGTGKPVRALDAGDVDGDGVVEIAIGCDDEHVYLVDASGKERWRFRCKRSEDALSDKPAVDFVKVVDLDGDGINEIVVGANWVHVLNSDGSIKWERYMVYRRGRITGDFACGTVADVDGDGSNEIIASFRTSYPLLQVFNARGEQINRPPKGHAGFVIDVPVAVTTIALRDKGKQIVSVEKKHLSVYPSASADARDRVARIRKSFAQIAIHQVSAGQPPIVVAATTMCDLFRITIRLRNKRIEHIAIDAKWLTNLGEKVTALLLADVNSDGHAEICVGTKAGNVHILNLNGTQLGRMHLADAPVTTLMMFDGKLLSASYGVWSITVSGRRAGE